MSFNEIVNVTISRDTRAVSRAAFGTAMFLGRHAFFAERAQSFADLEEVLAAGIPTNSPEGIAAAAYFGSDVTPTEIVIGRQIPTAVILTPTVQNLGVYTVYVGAVGATPVAFTYTADASASATEIAVGVKALVDANATIAALVTTSATGDVITFTKASTADIIVHSNTANLVATYTSSESLTAALTAVQAVNDSWYAVATYSHLSADIQEMAGVIGGMKRIYGYSTGEANVLTSTTPNIASILKAATRDRSFGIFDVEAGIVAQATSATTYGEMGWLGKMLPKDPGSATWMFKSVAGIAVDNLSSNESTYARGYNMNTYETFQGQNMVWEGKMADGTYIDIIHGADWLEARMTERLFYLLLNNDKIPYTDAGVTSIEGEVRAQLLEGVAAGYITPDFVITTPKVSTISSNDKANRVLPAVKFSATLQGAVHSVTVNGRVQA